MCKALNPNTEVLRCAVQEEDSAQAPALRAQQEKEMRQVQQRMSALRNLQPMSARAQVLQSKLTRADAAPSLYWMPKERFCLDLQRASYVDEQFQDQHRAQQ